MACAIVEFWQRCHGAIHPEDEAVLDGHIHSFNLDYPPPPYLGDPRSAPIVLLISHGGYDASMAKEEFATSEDVQRHLSRLHNPIAARFSEMSPYYLKRNYAELILNGNLVAVNALAYRFPRISEAPENKKIAKFLPSVEAHRRWLLDEVLPEALSGRRLIVAHQHRLWQLPKSLPEEIVVRTSAPINPDLDKDTMNRITKFLATL